MRFIHALTPTNDGRKEINHVRLGKIEPCGWFCRSEESIGAAVDSLFKATRCKHTNRLELGIGSPGN